MINSRSRMTLTDFSIISTCGFTIMYTRPRIFAWLLFIPNLQYNQLEEKKRETMERRVGRPPIVSVCVCVCVYVSKTVT